MESTVIDRMQTVDDAIARFVRPDTFPLAVRMLRHGEPVPEGVRVPSESLGERWIVCQSIGVARRFGWGVAVGKEDVICPGAAVAFGFRRPNDRYLKGYAVVGSYCMDEAAGTKLEAAVWRFEPGEYERLCVAPLGKATFEPHVVVIYGNSAQVMRLVNAALSKRGGRIHTTATGRVDCSDLVIQTMATSEPKVVLPCNGDRVFGMAQDTEMAFSIPWYQTGNLVEGLESTHRGGIRYPIPVAMRSTVTMPPRYQELLSMLEEQDAE